MAGHRRKMEAETNAEKRSQWVEKIDKWNKALKQVTDLKGMDVKGRKETEFIEEIVTDIHRRFGVPLSDSLPLLIGMEDEIEVITSWLTDGSCSHAADILTITGMGGIGKTSLAKYVFHLNSRTFDKSSFIEGINSRCTQQFNGLIDVQKQLYGDVSMKNNLRVHDTCVYTSKIEKALACTKVFLVLDDIDRLDQLDALLGKKGFHPGSKIMITTKYASLTERCALFNPEVQPKHTNILLQGLYEPSALKLLCLHAFKSKDPKAGYEEVIGKVVKYCEGHPLALEVLGRSLRNLDVNEWEDYIERLKKETDPSIKKVLKVSFDSLLSRNDKELFLHIACFFVGKDREHTETILKACGINTISGIRNLIDRCLLRVGWGNHLVMHQLLQEMGKDAVREESPDYPGKRSRLWCHEESFKVLKRKKGTENLKGLVLDTRMLEKVLHGSFELKTDAFCNMDNLMLLQLNYVLLSGSFESFPEDIRWLCMHGLPLKSIPADLPMENLVILDMSYSNFESFGMADISDQQPPASRQKLIGSCSKDKQILGSLKILDLSFCGQLHTLGGFIRLPALERLIVRSCISLTAISESLEECVDLVLIDLSYCIKLEKLPTAIGKLKKIKTLLLDGCNNCESRMKVWETDSQERLVAYSIGINSQTSSSAILESIPRELNFSVISFPSSLVRLSFADNNLSSESFPMDMSRLSLLKYLCLDGNPIVSMPSCVRSLPKLEQLSMKYCDMLTSIEHPPCTLRVLNFWTSNRMHQLQGIVFDKEMSPLELSSGNYYIRFSSAEIEGMVKIQPMAGVEEKVLRSLGWSNLDFIKKRRIGTYHSGRWPEGSQTQMYYEYGIFSTMYGGEEMPKWISETRSEGASISFTIPLSSPKKKKLRGLNFCNVQRRVWVEKKSRYWTDRYGYPVHQLLHLPMIEISNKTKSRTWIYCHCIGHEGVNVGGEGLTYLSHWMFGKDDDDMGAGDEITITLNQRVYSNSYTKECGVSFVYEEEDGEEDDGLGYYKAWNHIIGGGDLSPFQLTTGEYFLHIRRFLMVCITPCVLGIRREYKDKRFLFRAFSKKKNP